MTTGTLLYVGDDACQRIPVMRQAGLHVTQSDGTIPAIHRVLTSGVGFRGISFHNDIRPISDELVSMARELSVASLILFENPSVVCDRSAFDLVIRKLTPPPVWLPSLAKAIEEARSLKEVSRQLRLDAAEARSQSRTLQRKIARNLPKLIDVDSLWRGDSD